MLGGTLLAGFSARDLGLALVSILGVIPVVLAIAWLTTKFRYRITATHLEVTLFGLTVRRLSLADIRRVSARRLFPDEWGEQWWNTLKPSRRFLTIKRRSGWLKYFVITPKHRYIFKAELEQAMAALRPANEPAEAGDPRDQTEEDTPEETPGRQG
jgi:hypothetical protein